MDSSSRVVRGLLIPISTLLASVVVTLFFLEAGLRLWDGVPLFSTDNFVAVELDSVHRAGNPGIYDPQVGWISMPNSSWSVGGKRVEADGYLTFGEYGIRMSSPDRVPPPQGATLMVGDSFAAGSEVRDADSWPAKLERMTGTPVLNAGTGGYGLDQIVLRAETLLPILRPRMLIVQSRLEFGLSVMRMSIFGGTPKPYFTIENGILKLQNVPVPQLASRHEEIGRLRSVFGHSYLIQFTMTRLNLLQWWVLPSMATQFALSGQEAVEIGCLLMQRLAQLGQRTGVRVALVFQYAGPDGINPTLAWENDRRRITACAAQQIPEIVDTLDALRSVYRTEGLPAYQKLFVMHENNRLYGHMSEEGNQMTAELIYGRLFGENRTGSPTNLQKSK